MTGHIIGEKLVKLYQCILDKFRLTDTMEGGITRLLSKVLGVPAVDELRPITLLNCDYKILTKYFTRRLVPVLPEVILSGQLAGIPGGNILFGITNLLSSVEYVALKKFGAAIINYDMFKAYDRVMVRFLCQVMEAIIYRWGLETTSSSVWRCVMQTSPPGSSSASCPIPSASSSPSDRVTRGA